MHDLRNVQLHSVDPKPFLADASQLQDSLRCVAFVVQVDLNPIFRIVLQGAVSLSPVQPASLCASYEEAIAWCNEHLARTNHGPAAAS